MRALIVYARPEPRIFNAAILQVVVSELRAANWQVEISDLYAEGFQAVASRSDLTAPTLPR